MKKLTFVTVALVALMLGSCVENSEKYKTVVVEKEKISETNTQLQAENADLHATLQAIDNALKSIDEAEGLMEVQSESGDKDYAAKLIQIKEVMAQNRARLEALEADLQKANSTASSHAATIKKLRAQLAEKEEMIANLQAQVAEKDEQIAGLNNEVSTLNNNLNNANNEIANLNNNLTNQTNELNAVYYVNGTMKELKAKGVILSKTKVLKGEVPTSEFTKADMRNLTSITFNSKKAVVLSTHPADSYTLVKGVDADGKKIMTLEITNPEMFWKVTKYLVVLTK